MEPKAGSRWLSVTMTMPWPAEHPPARGARTGPTGQRNGRFAQPHLRPVVGCDAVCEELPLVVDGSRRASTAMSEHLRSCPRCQAEMSSYQRLLRTLKSLKDEPLELTAGVVAAGPYIVERLVAQRNGGRGRHALGAPGLMGRAAGAWPGNNLAVPSWAVAGALGAVVLAVVGLGAVSAARRWGPAPLGT